MIQFLLKNDCVIFIDETKIVAVQDYPREMKSRIFVMGSDEPFEVEHSITDVMNLITEAKNGTH